MKSRFLFFIYTCHLGIPHIDPKFTATTQSEVFNFGTAIAVVVFPRPTVRNLKHQSYVYTKLSRPLKVRPQVRPTVLHIILLHLLACLQTPVRNTNH